MTQTTDRPDGEDGPDRKDKHDNEANRPAGRLKRYARVGAGLAPVAARFAAGRLAGAGGDKAAQAEQLRAALGTLKGPLMKLAQLASTIPDLLPPEYAAELSQLQADAPSMGWPFVRRRMAAELGPDWSSRFESFDKTASAAASLGQVHKARGVNGEDFACKLQYPDMLSAVDAKNWIMTARPGIWRFMAISCAISTSSRCLVWSRICPPAG
jgi:predicted unusual protein kinase regulating ubiquinone biosynthesis (AarF/ABC1/UbiB family)